MEVPSFEPSPVTVDQPPVIITKRYVFNETAISNLRAKASSENSKHSRVTLVSSLIWKALITVDQVKSGRLRENLLAPTINLRGKTGSLVTESSFGNVWIPYPIRFSQTITEPEFTDLVALIEDTTRNIINWLRKASGEEICTQAKSCYNEVFEELKQNKFCLITIKLVSVSYI
ncbi:putative vinorine synthase [Helianthus debilis subsp. tardiflorus]